MPTVFDCLNRYCAGTGTSIPDNEHVVSIGKNVAHYYVNHREEFPHTLRREWREEPGGLFKVIIYPHCFVPTIKTLIALYFDDHPQLKPIVPRIRKRIPYNPHKPKQSFHGSKK